MYAANASIGIWSTDRYPHLISIADHLYQIVKTFVAVRPQHVPAHAGQPHNEAADSACSAISVGDLNPPHIVPPYDFSSASFDLQWAFLYFGKGAFHDGYPSRFWPQIFGVDN
eukprot:11233364-Karenia_brevis.AAC.1